MTDKNGPPPDEPKEPPEQGPRPEASQNEEYKVGPGRPPKEYTWKRGGPTPNPTGRRGKNPSIEPDLKRLFEKVFFRTKFKVTRNEKKVLLNRIELGFEQLANQFGKGDRHARRDTIMIAEKLGVDLSASARKMIEALTSDHQAILDAYVGRRTGKADAAPAPPVIAPPELLDDDVAQPEPSSDQATTSSVPSEPPPKKLPQTSQDIREERLKRHKRQAEFDAARAAAAKPTPDTVDPQPATPQPPTDPVAAATEPTATGSVVDPPQGEPAPPAIPSPTTTAAEHSDVDPARVPRSPPNGPTPRPPETEPANSSSPPPGPQPPETTDPNPGPPLAMKNPYGQGRPATEKEKHDWLLYLRNQRRR